MDVLICKSYYTFSMQRRMFTLDEASKGNPQDERFRLSKSQTKHTKYIPLSSPLTAPVYICPTLSVDSYKNYPIRIYTRTVLYKNKIWVSTSNYVEGQSPQDRRRQLLVVRGRKEADPSPPLHGVPGVSSHRSGDYRET